jgi:hypothetical protein
LLYRYGGFAHYELEAKERDFTITLIPDLGEKWLCSLNDNLKLENVLSLLLIPEIGHLQNTYVILCIFIFQVFL